MKEKEIERLTKLKEIEEKIYNSKEVKYICGIDEAGRGPLAGPVVIAAVIMPRNSMIEGVNDSKKVSEKKREKLYDLIIEEAISYSVAIIGQDVIDDIKKNSRHFAKRQYTFFNHQFNTNWFEVDLNNFSNTINEVINFLKKF